MAESSAAPGWKRALKRWQPWIVRTIGLFLLGYLLWQADLEETLATWIQADKGLLALGAALAYLMMLAKIERWRRLLRAQAITFSFRDAHAAYFSTYYAGIVTPGRAGEFLKVLYLHQKTGATLAAGLVSVLVDRVLDVLVLAALAALGIAVVPELAFLNQVWLWAAGLLGGAAGVVLAVRGRWFQRTAGRLLRMAGERTGDSGAERLDEFFDGLRSVLAGKALFPAAGLTLVSWVCLLGACYLLAHSLGIPAGFWFLSFAMAIAGLLSLLPVSIAGIGVRDSALVAIFGQVGVGAGAALAYSLLYFSVFSLALGLIGAYYWYRYPLQGKAKEGASVSG